MPSWTFLQGIETKRKNMSLSTRIFQFNMVKLWCVCVEDKIVESPNVSAKSQLKNKISIRVVSVLRTHVWCCLIVLDIRKLPNDLVVVACVFCKQISYNVILSRVIVVVVVVFFFLFLLAWLMSGVCVCVCVLCSKLLFLWSLH